jgi:hypothetical protein
MPDPVVIRKWRPFAGRRPWEPEVPEAEHEELELARRTQEDDLRRANQSVPPPPAQSRFGR